MGDPVDRAVPGTLPNATRWRKAFQVVARSLAVSWASPVTLLGLLLVAVALASRGRAARVSGVIEAHGGWLSRLLERATLLPRGVAALTLGHVVLGVDRESLARHRAHERVHVRQYERWGPLFLPAYAGASLWAWARGGDPYLDNWFEREARARSTA